MSGKLVKHQFRVVSYLIITFNSIDIEKQFNIKDFLESFDNLSNQNRTKIKQHFIDYLHLLLENDLIEDKILVLRDNLKYPVTSLTTSNISDGFIIYEKLKL